MAQVAWFQHGDVCLVPAAMPSGVKPVESRIIATGEVTGHAHRLTEDSDVDLFEYEGTLFLRVGPHGAEIVHEEHKPGLLPQGEYRVERVQEYDHFAEEARAVMD